MTVEVRKASIEDAARLARIHLDAWRAAYPGMVSQALLDGLDFDDSADRWRQALRGEWLPDVAVFVSSVDGVVACFSVGGRYRQQEEMPAEDTAGWGELYSLYADPKLTARGAGTAAHDALLAHLAGEGFKQAALWVLEANRRARAWYGSRGWTPDGAVNSWVSHGVAHPEVRLRRTLSTEERLSPS